MKQVKSNSKFVSEKCQVYSEIINMCMTCLGKNAVNAGKEFHARRDEMLERIWNEMFSYLYYVNNVSSQK